MLVKQYGAPQLYCVHRKNPTIPLRVVMASRIGDVGVTTDLDSMEGDINRVSVKELDLFNNKREWLLAEIRRRDERGNPLPSETADVGHLQ